MSTKSEKQALRKHKEKSYVWITEKIKHDPRNCLFCYNIKYCGCASICDRCNRHLANCNTSLCKECK